MRLYHRTPHGEQVHRHGFAPEHADAAGRLWLSGDPADLPSIGRWLVIVDVDDERAEPYRYRLPDGTPYAANFLIPHEVLNEHRPFELQAVADVPALPPSVDSILGGPSIDAATLASLLTTASTSMPLPGEVRSTLIDELVRLRDAHLDAADWLDRLVAELRANE